VRQEARSIATSRASKTIAGEAFAFAAGALDADWNDPLVRGGHADAALTLFLKNPNDAALVRAFREFQLDSRNPYHWRLLIGFMADALFGVRGRPKKWTGARQRQLVERIDDLLREHQNPRGMVLKAIGKLKDTWPLEYKMYSDDDLRVRYYRSKRPKLVTK
jgi:hypothetical protein